MKALLIALAGAAAAEPVVVDFAAPAEGIEVLQAPRVLRIPTTRPVGDGKVVDFSVRVPCAALCDLRFVNIPDFAHIESVFLRYPPDDLVVTTEGWTDTTLDIRGPSDGSPSRTVIVSAYGQYPLGE